MSSMVDQQQRARILRGLFDSYYADRDEPVVFDTSRSWAAQLPALMNIFPEAKVVCLVRDLAWIMDSMERQLRCIFATFDLIDFFCVNFLGEREIAFLEREGIHEQHASRINHVLRKACNLSETRC